MYVHAEGGGRRGFCTRRNFKKLHEDSMGNLKNAVLQINFQVNNPNSLPQVQVITVARKQQRKPGALLPGT